MAVATLINVFFVVAALILPIYFAQDELIKWEENRYLRCIFCMDYDDRVKLSIFGCSLAKPPTCYGNICYMRQHKSNHYYLYTSGCLNLTQNEFDTVGKRISSTKPIRGLNGVETQLCEVSKNLLYKKNIF
uniref:Uncharacterized protein n=1 Tax=Panagrolaimus sp. PS1159 TaxID=55785 RepID=A0AC35G426_9BILA